MLPTSCYSVFKVQWAFALRLRSLAHGDPHSKVRSTRLKPTLFICPDTIRPVLPPVLEDLPCGVACLFCQKLDTSFVSMLSIQSKKLNPLSLSGDEGIRTPGLRLAKAALSQLSYIPRNLGRCLSRGSACPCRAQVGLSGIEPETSPLSEARSNQLS